MADDETMTMSSHPAGLATALLAALLIHAGALAAFLWWPPATHLMSKTPGTAGIRLVLGARVPDGLSEPIVPDIPRRALETRPPLPPEEPALSPPSQAAPPSSPRQTASPAAPVTGLTAGAGESAALTEGKVVGLGDQDAQATYLAELQSWLARYKEYPYSARRRGLEGRAILRFTVARSGDVLDYRLDQSTGVPILDREVEKMIERARPLPPFPPGLNRETLNISIPIKFDLDD